MSENHFQLRKVCATLKLSWSSQPRAEAALGRKTACALTVWWGPQPCQWKSDTLHSILSAMLRLGWGLPCTPLPAHRQWPKLSSEVVSTALLSFQDEICSALPSRLAINYRLSICDFPAARPSNFFSVLFFSVTKKHAFIYSIRKNASLHKKKNPSQPLKLFPCSLTHLTRA